VQKLRDQGVAIRVLRVDVADFDALSSAFDDIDATLPPLKGIVHCAGVLADAAFTRQTWADFLTAMGPKVTGTWNLHELSRCRDLDYFVLFSSVAAVIGWPGQANYGAGNAVMDGIARYRRARGLPALSINWGAWGAAGMAQNVRDQLGDPFSAHGLIPHDAREGIDTFVGLVQDGASEALVGHFDWQRFAGRYPSARVPAVFSRVCGGRTGPAASVSLRQVQHRLVDDLKGMPLAQRRRVLEQFLVEQAASALGLSAATSVNRKVPLNEQGLDSLLAVEMRNAIAAALGCSLPASLLFDYPSINALGRHLLDDVLRQSAIGGGDSRQPGSASPKDVLEADIESLSDEEAERLLSQELGGPATDRKTAEAVD
jgi:acyl carrier protein